MQHTLSIGLFLVISLFSSVISSTENELATLRNKTKISEQKIPNLIPKVVNQDIKKARSYPMQPPVIPHSTRNYELNKNNNKCLSCHARQRTEDSQAPMISVTHFMDRDGNFLAEISPRRYFCTQCHVTQVDAKPLVENTFIDMHRLMKSSASSTKDK